MAEEEEVSGEVGELLRFEVYVNVDCTMEELLAAAEE